MKVHLHFGFDKVSYPTLIKKLSKCGIGRATLRIIASFYTGVKTKLFVNGVLVKVFSVCNGVAQGCIVSLLFFTIYIDNFLKKFWQSGLGIPVGLLGMVRIFILVRVPG